MSTLHEAASVSPSRPRAGRALRILMYAILLAVACGAIWWIDRGANLTNSHPSAAAVSAH